MAKQINFTYEGNRYTLEYDRASVKMAETRGFNVSKAEEMPLSTTMMLIECAFVKHHATLSADEIYKIYEKLPNKDVLIGKLMEMYGDTIKTLHDEPDDVGKVNWSANW